MPVLREGNAPVREPPASSLPEYQGTRRQDGTGEAERVHRIYQSPDNREEELAHAALAQPGLEHSPGTRETRIQIPEVARKEEEMLDGGKNNCYTCSSPFAKGEQRVELEGIKGRFVHESYMACSRAMNYTLADPLEPLPPRPVREAAE
jgi:hypothetical protein